ncbi:hypothetical protein WP8S17C03_45420 [Metapseudomonas otitidis]|uniref:Uncharacterized protein n=1 Tax=Metapseudomonas otitidis TaxID=319939 RepID=A0A6S5RUF2_9GAMM|nr:hypothetical protein [Pseudomonas otitidis]BBT18493.1 hypothetical protein WP8S17C03_45420 [Pseudomonas otitidis]
MKYEIKVINQSQQGSDRVIFQKPPQLPNTPRPIAWQVIRDIRAPDMKIDFKLDYGVYVPGQRAVSTPVDMTNWGALELEKSSAPAVTEQDAQGKESTD